MTADTLTISTLADEAHRAFERRYRDPGAEPYYSVREGTPDWIRDMIREAHQGMMPDDWRYDCIHSALSHISDEGAETADELDDAGHEFADSHVDVYTAGRLKWLASNLNRLAYVDDAVDKLGGEGLSTAERIGLGQYVESLEVFESVRQSLAERMDELTD